MIYIYKTEAGRQADRSAGRQVGTLIIYLTEEKAISNIILFQTFMTIFKKKIYI